MALTVKRNDKAVSVTDGDNIREKPSMLPQPWKRG